MSTVGPNTVIQLVEALRTLRPEALEAVAVAAGAEPFVAAPPKEMIDERVPQLMFHAVTDLLGEDGDVVLAAAGAATARYLLQHRIPPVARAMLPRLPEGLAVRLLLAAIERASWTFAGSGSCAIDARALTIAANPLATPGCPWHLGVFETLTGALIGRRVAIHHTACCARGDDVCRFEVRPVRQTAPVRASRLAASGPSA